MGINLGALASLPLPRDAVIVTNGQVVHLELWDKIAGDQLVTLEIRRDDSGLFTVYKRDRKQTHLTGTLEKATESLPPATISWLGQIFRLTGLKPEIAYPELVDLEIKFED